MTAEIYGYDIEDMYHVDPVALVHPDDRPMVEAYRHKRLNGEEIPSKYEVRGLKKDGGSIWLRRMINVVDYNGRPAILGNVLDITPLKETKAALTHQTEELERSNRELEKFAFVASHDLSEPLRKILFFSDRLQQKSSGSLDGQMRDYIRRMRDVAMRMQTMINSLLTYSRITDRGRTFSHVNLGDAVAVALSNLEITIRETGADITVEKLPVINANRSLIIQLFQNLIGNSLKFHQKDTSPRIRIHGEITGESITGIGEESHAFCGIYVEDEGIGFDMVYIERIFRLFERLHGRDAYEGSGMGLGICRKIVECHGGDITAESEPGKGATFIVSLPIKGPPQASNLPFLIYIYFRLNIHF